MRNLALSSSTQYIQGLGCFLSILYSLEYNLMVTKKSARLMHYTHRLIASPPLLPSNVKTPHFHQQGG